MTILEMLDQEFGSILAGNLRDFVAAPDWQ
jgi:hypothetical protein